MTFDLTPHQRTILMEHAAISPNEEVCGLICGSGDIVSLPNVSATPERAFEMTVDDVEWAIDKFGPRLAVWHTHPSGDPRPSTGDLAHMPEGDPFVVATSREVGVYHGTGTATA